VFLLQGGLLGFVGSLFGAAMGAATGLIHGAATANSPDAVHRRFVEYCLSEKGYKPMGWK